MDQRQAHDEVWRRCPPRALPGPREFRRCGRLWCVHLRPGNVHRKRAREFVTRFAHENIPSAIRARCPCHSTQSGVYAQDEFRVSDRLTLTYGVRWQALPAFVSDLGNLTAFDIRNGGIIIPVGNQPRPGFLATINSCNPVDPNNPVDPCGAPSPADTALG